VKSNARGETVAVDRSNFERREKRDLGNVGFKNGRRHAGGFCSPDSHPLGRRAQHLDLDGVSAEYTQQGGVGCRIHGVRLAKPSGCQGAVVSAQELGPGFAGNLSNRLEPRL